MKLKDLKQGMICELRNGHEIIILGNNKYVCNGSSYAIYQLSKDYNDNLININKKVRTGINYDIMKVTFGDEVIYERHLKTRELAEQLIETHSDDLKLMLEVENE